MYNVTYSRDVGHIGAQRSNAREAEIPAVCGGTKVGGHEVVSAGENRRISIRHQAFSRQMFAT
ncbi:MAG: hypothetical protein JXK93_05525 [Sphaerochaetaceae bacterium]|nr:hypothetical protein [Sphaerochaetaceae bacterium]